jgi:hypothetical protein
MLYLYYNAGAYFRIYRNLRGILFRQGLLRTRCRVGNMAVNGVYVLEVLRGKNRVNYQSESQQRQYRTPDLLPASKEENKTKYCEEKKDDRITGAQQQYEKT